MSNSLLSTHKTISNLEKYAGLFLLCLLIYQNTYEAVGHICKVLFGQGFWMDNVLYGGVVIGTALLFVVYYLLSQKIVGVGIPCLVILAAGISVIRNFELLGIMVNNLSALVLCFLVYKAFYCCEPKMVLYYLKKARWPMLAIFILAFFLLRQEVYIDSANQVISYNVAATAVLFLWGIVEEGGTLRSKLSNIIGYIMCCILTLAFSSRGAAVGLCMATGIILILQSKSFKFFLIPLAGILFYNLEAVLEFVQSCLNTLGINGRITSYLTATKFFSQEGRTPIYNCIEEAIRQRPLMGYGMFGDRLVLKDTFGYESYPHNIVREMLCQYGVIVGSMLLVCLLILLIRLLMNKAVDVTSKLLVCFLLVRGIVCLLFSGSYITSIEFFAIVAIVMRNRKTVR